MRQVHLTFTIVLAILAPVFLVLTPACSQEKPPSLFDSTEFSEKESGIETATDDSQVANFQTSAYRKGEGIKLGLNYMPLDFDEFVFCSSSLIEKVELEKSFAAFAPRLIQLKQMVGIDWSGCEFMVRGWLGNSFSYYSPNSKFGTRPNLMVIQAKSAFDQSNINAEKIEKLGLNYFRSDEGVTFGFPKPDILVIGTTNEVINAMRMENGTSNNRQPGVEWIDYHKFDSVRLARARSGRSSQAFFTKGEAQGRIQLFQNSGLAKHEKERLELYNEFLNSDDPAAFLAKNERDMKTKGVLVLNINDKQRQELITLANNHQKHYSSQTVTFEHDGARMLVTETWDNRTFHVGSAHLQELLPRLFEQRTRTRTDSEIEQLTSFEKYQFEDRDGSEAEGRLASSFGSNYALSEGVNDFSDRPSDYIRLVETALNNTSSRVLRNRLVQLFVEAHTPQSIMILGLEAHRFDLADAQNTMGAEDDDRPSIMGKPSGIHRIKKTNLQSLTKKLRYYLANPGDPILLTAVCKIAGDLKLSELQSLIKRLADSNVSERTREAANEALASIADRNSTPKNVLKAPADAATALSWLQHSERAKKAAALVWVMRNPELGADHSQFIESLILLLDDGLYYREATIVLKKICKPEDATHFRDVLALAADPNNRNFKMRQKYSVMRVAEMAFHLKDQEGIKLAYEVADYEMERFLTAYTKTHGADVGELNRESMNDFVESFMSNPTRNGMIRLASLELNKDQKASLMKWANEVWAAHGEASKDSRFWDVIENCPPYGKQDIPILIDLLFSESGYHKEVVEFLSKQGPEIEALVLAELDAGRKTWSVDETLALLKSVGTQKSVPYLNSYKVNDGNERGKRINEQIDVVIEAIESRD